MTTAEDVIVVEPVFDPTAPPDRRLPPKEWARRNLWSTPFNALLTVVFGAVLAYVAYRLVRFVFVTADWEVVRQNLRLFMVGLFPEDELWRPWTAAYILAGALGLTSGVATTQITGAPTAPLRTRIALGLRRFWPLVVFGIAILALIDTVVPGLLLIGLAATVVASRAAGKRVPGLARWVLLILALAFVAALFIVLGFGGVGWDDWGGLQLTLFVTTAGILIASPFGLVLALARRSTLPLVRWMAIGFIELFRGVPLVALLFMGQYIILFTFPTSVTPPGFLVRALIVIALFEAAYIAEIVQGRAAVGVAGPGGGRPRLGNGAGVDDAQGRAAPSAASRDPGDRGPVHQPVQGHLAPGHRRVLRGATGRPFRAQPGRVRRPRPVIDHTRLRRLHLLGWRVHTVAREPPARAAAGSGNPMTEASESGGTEKVDLTAGRGRSGRDRRDDDPVRGRREVVR